MKTIIASNNPDAYALIDDDVFDVIQEMNLKFSIMSDGYWLATSHMIQLPGMNKKKRLLLHVFVYILKTGIEPNKTVDHIDIDKSNNQFGNLRLATRQQQNQHQSKRKNNSTGYIGVSHQHNVNKYNKKYDYWRAFIYKPDGHREYKIFPYTEAGKLEAVRWRDQKAREYYGDFAVLNFPDNGQ